MEESRRSTLKSRPMREIRGYNSDDAASTERFLLRSFFPREIKEYIERRFPGYRSLSSFRDIGDLRSYLKKYHSNKRVTEFVRGVSP